VVACKDWETDVIIAIDLLLAVGSKVFVKDRTENIYIDLNRSATGLNVLAGRVTDLGYFGKDSLYRVKLPSNTLVRVNRVNERRASEGERVAVWEDDVYLSFEPSAAILLKE
jgi:putrescine transport system ATP-binding protein